MESGGEASGDKKETASQEPKDPAPKEQETSSQPSGGQEKEAPKPKEEEKPAPPKEEKKPEPPKQESKPQPPPQQEKKPQPPKKETEQKQPAQESPFGSREERRVSQPGIMRWDHVLIIPQVKMNRMRLRIAERLKQSQNTAASLTTFNEVDMSSIMEFRKLYKDDVLKKTGVKLGFMSAFSRACILAMRDIPAVNASIEGAGGGDTIVYRDYVDISVAVATEKGLVTPVVRNAESMDIVGIEKAISDLGKKARDNKLTIEDMAGGTFTISNVSFFASWLANLHWFNNRVVSLDPSWAHLSSICHKLVCSPRLAKKLQLLT